MSETGRVLYRINMRNSAAHWLSLQQHRYYLKYNTHYKQVMCTKHSKSVLYRAACKLLPSTNNNTLQVTHLLSRYLTSKLHPATQLCHNKDTILNTCRRTKLLYAVQQQRNSLSRTRKCITYIL